MTDANLAAIVLAAGQGTRMKSDLPKVLHPLAGRPMISHLLDSIGRLNPARIVTVLSPAVRAQVEPAVADTLIAVQDPPKGTGHAVMAARAAMAGFTGDVLIMFGDTPLVTEKTLRAMQAARRGGGNPAVAVLGFRPDDPAEYGRLIRGADGNLNRIVEYRDADADERTVGLCNAGVMAVDGEVLFDLLDATDNDNAKGEYYLTDIVAAARTAGRVCTVVEGDPDEVLGINSRAQLAGAEAIRQNQLRAAAMENGATLIDPATVYFSFDTALGHDVTVGPNVVFGPGVSIADGVEIKAFCHLENCNVAAGATIGPFARLRPDADIGPGARVGNFVEVKNAVVEEGAKINHLTYVGDAHIGAKANIGAGTITCNYDGFLKWRTEIGPGASIGSNTSLVAPVTVGAGAITGAGSVIRDDVPADALAVSAGPQTNKDGFAVGYREAKAAEKAAKRKS